MSEKIILQNSKEDNLVGVLANPREGADIPILVMAHGFSSGKDGRKYVTLEQRMNSLGVATFRFDFYGHNESDGKFEDVTVSEAVDDI